MVFNTGPYTDLPDNSILITANMQSETGCPDADAGLLVNVAVNSGDLDVRRTDSNLIERRMMNCSLFMLIAVGDGRVTSHYYQSFTHH